MFPQLAFILCFFLARITPDARAQEAKSDPSDTSRYVQNTSSVVILRFGGDCLLADHYQEFAGDSVNRAFAGFDLLNTADIAMVNLECPVTTRGHKIVKPFNFRMQPRFLTALNSAGVDVVNIANNHIYDFGKVGLFDTISYLDSIEISHVGAGRNRNEAHAPALFDVRGVHIAVLGYYGGGEAPKASVKSAGVADRRIEDVRFDIEKIRRQNSAAYIVVNLHWGTEKATAPDDGQIEFAHKVIDAGADIIIGHHPHVLQGIEQYKSGVIVYSLGNFLFGGNSRDTYDTGLFEVCLSKGRTDYRLIPIRVKRWKAMELSGIEAEQISNYVQQLSRKFSKSIFNDKEAR